MNPSLQQVFTVTLNPSLDRTLSVQYFVPDSIHRAQVQRVDLGGKGINVSRALRHVGIESTIVAVLGGTTGRIIEERLAHDGHKVFAIHAEGETRQNITVLSESDNRILKFNEPGAMLSAHGLDQLLGFVEENTSPNSLWAFCGSLPPDAIDELYGQLIEMVNRQGGKAFLDTSGMALWHGIQARPFCVKPNEYEIEQIPGVDAGQLPASQAAVLSTFGVDLTAISLGKKGILVRQDGGTWQAIPPEVQVRSNVGAGDAALAGIIWSVIEECEASETARRAVAVGTACAMTEGTGMGERELIDVLLPQIEVFAS